MYAMDKTSGLVSLQDYVCKKQKIRYFVHAYLRDYKKIILLETIVAFQIAFQIFNA